LNCWVDAVDVSQLDEITAIIERELNYQLSGNQTLVFDWFCQR
jgi:hypothetical protein